MPNKASARKSLRQTKARTARNTQRKEAFKNAIKAALKTSTATEAIKLAVKAQQALDKAAKNGVIKRATASRKLSRLMKKVKAIGSATK